MVKKEVKALKRKKNPQKTISNKKRFFFLLLSTCFNLTALSIIMLRSFYPYHRSIALAIYLLGWLPFLYVLRLKPENLIKRQYLKISLRIIIYTIILWLILSLFPADKFPMLQSDKEQLRKNIDREIILTENYLPKLREAENIFLNEVNNITLSNASPEKKTSIMQAWGSYVMYFTTLNQISEKNRYFYQISYLKERELNEQSFMLAYATFIGTYASALRVIHATQNIEFLGTLLNEEHSEEEVPEGIYDLMGVRVADLANIPQANAGYAYLLTISQPRLAALSKYATEDYLTTLSYYDKSPQLRMRQALIYFEKNLFTAWFPVQKEVSELMGDTKIPLRDKTYISQEKIAEITPLLQPLDISLQRRNWYLSNVGLPGFWKHTAIYIGNLSILNDYFSSTAQETNLTNHLPISAYLKKNNLPVFQVLSDGQLRTIEAESEGVISLPVNQSFTSDYLAILRPNVSKEEKLAALIYIVAQFQKPYDFDFDFLSDNTLVCSEVYVKAFPQMDYTLKSYSGRLIFSANDIAKSFDQDYGTPKNKLEFITFFDSNETSGETFNSTLDQFRISYLRSPTEFNELV